jgi:hypothetical protein
MNPREPGYHPRAERGAFPVIKPSEYARVSCELARRAMTERDFLVALALAELADAWALKALEAEKGEAMLSEPLRQLWEAIREEIGAHPRRFVIIFLSGYFLILAARWLIFGLSPWQ